MHQMIRAFIEIAIFIIILLVFLFLFVDGKIENTQLQTRCDLLNEKVTDLKEELAGVRRIYSGTLITMIRNDKIALDELERLLPAHEFNYLQTAMLSQEDPIMK